MISRSHRPTIKDPTSSKVHHMTTESIFNPNVPVSHLIGNFQTLTPVSTGGLILKLLRSEHKDHALSPNTPHTAYMNTHIACMNNSHSIYAWHTQHIWVTHTEFMNNTHSMYEWHMAFMNNTHSIYEWHTQSLWIMHTAYMNDMTIIDIQTIQKENTFILCCWLGLVVCLVG